MNWCENVILLSVTDSTNNYAMRVIDADKAQAGTLIVAGRQEAGKGQRGRSWQDEPGGSLLMSLIIQPQRTVIQQFAFSAAVAVAVATVAGEIVGPEKVSIKWPNDLIIKDKKSGGILIENVLRGSQWSYAVAGIGINVNQSDFSDLPHATSFYLNGGAKQDLPLLANRIRQSVHRWLSVTDDNLIFLKYNELLFRRDSYQLFKTPNGLENAWVEKASADGRLQVHLSDGTVKQLSHGEWEWVW